MMRLVTCICVLTPLEIFAKAKKKVIGVLFLTGLIVSALCVLAMSTGSPNTVKGVFGWTTKPPADSALQTDVLMVFLTGNELGALQPCGCSGGQLGGLDRRSALLNSVPASRRLIVDTGRFVEGNSEQDLIKFSILVQAFGLLDYDLVNLTTGDIEIAKNLGLLDSIGSVFNIISSRSIAGVDVPAKFTKELLLKEKTVAVTVAAFDAESAPIEQVEKLFDPRPGLQTVNILILNRCDAGVVASVAGVGSVDCLVCPGESDEPRVIGNPNERPLIVSVGRLGKYVTGLQITAGEAKDKLNLSFSAIPVAEDLPQQSFLLELYETYQQVVKEANLLEKLPRFVLPNGLKYTGSRSCKLCHKYEYEKWSTQSHAHAYATLEKVGSAFDPECVLCHVVGMEYEDGFVSEKKTDYLKNVGCENCHGPGSEHIRTLGKAKTTEPKSNCTKCHTPDRSANYTADEQLYFEKIIHWREPNAPDDVKE